MALTPNQLKTEFQRRRYVEHLQGIVDLMVRYEVSIEELNTFLRNEYKPKEVRVAESRLNYRRRIKRSDIAKKAIEARWQRQRDFLAAPTPAEKAQASGVATPELAAPEPVNVPVPDLTPDEEVTTTEASVPESAPVTRLSRPRRQQEDS